MVKCKICGKKFKQLTSSGHLRKHNMTREEYLFLFPDAKVVSDATRNAHSKSMKKRVKEGNHFVPFRDVEGLAQKVRDEHKEGPVEYECIRCGKKRSANRFLAEKRKFCSNNCYSRHVAENPDLYKDRNRKISQSNKGKPKSAKLYSRCNGGFRNDLGHYVRSGWEADVCRIFLYNNKPYDYEAYVVQLKDKNDILTWVVDFVDTECFMSDGLIEVKGWWDDKSKKKLRLLKRQRPDLYNKLTIIDQISMMQFVQEYRDLIPEWETRKRKLKP